MTEKIVYAGKDLEAMSFAVNFHRWILEEFRPLLGKNIIEVGAGTGSFSKLLLSENLKSLTLIEPSEMFEKLKEHISQIQTQTRIDLQQSVFAEVCKKNVGEKMPDSIVYINVLEHIEDDQKELEMIYQTLEKGGRCFIFVPALMSLYGKFDRKIGHFRRYQKNELEEKCKTAGFRIIKSKYLDFAGIFPWWVKYKIFKSDSLGNNSVQLYDQIAVPIVRRIERLFHVPLGKNVLLVGEK